MTGHRRLLMRPGRSLIIVAILIVGHGIAVYFVSSHMTLSAAALSSVLILIVIKHLGLLGALFALFRRRSRH